MKKLLLPLSILLLSTSLTGCTDDDSWKEEYGTPELFLNTVINGNYHPRFYKYETESQTMDDNFEVANYILNVGPFEASKNKSKRVEKYFTYQGYWQAATSGPNYCNMSIWEDGFIVIRHKRSLGRLQAVYFTMDHNKAIDVVDFVFNKIDQSSPEN